MGGCETHPWNLLRTPLEISKDGIFLDMMSHSRENLQDLHSFGPIHKLSPSQEENLDNALKNH